MRANMVRLARKRPCRIALAGTNGGGRPEVTMGGMRGTGQKIVRPDRLGFGLKLIQEQAEYDLDGNAEVAFEPTGLRVHLKFP